MRMSDDPWLDHWSELAQERVSAAVVSVACIPATLLEKHAGADVIGTPFGSMYRYTYGWVALVSPEVLEGREKLEEHDPDFGWMEFARRTLVFCARNKVRRLFFDVDGLSNCDSRGPFYAELEACRTLVTCGKLRVTEPGVRDTDYPDYLQRNLSSVVWDAETAMESVELI